LAFASADVNWRADAAEAEYDFAAAETGREYDLLVAEGAIERELSVETARAAAVQDVAFARAERTKMLADEAARGVERYARAEATADFQSAVDESKVDAMDQLMAGLPRAGGAVHGIQAGYIDGYLLFIPDFWAGAPEDGNFTIDGTGFTNHLAAGGGTVSCALSQNLGR
jgi:hypothetical protein